VRNFKIFPETSVKEFFETSVVKGSTRVSRFKVPCLCVFWKRYYSYVATAGPRAHVMALFSARLVRLLVLLLGTMHDGWKEAGGKPAASTYPHKSQK
jgi:hypothetical protein